MIKLIKEYFECNHCGNVGNSLQELKENRKCYYCGENNTNTSHTIKKLITTKEDLENEISFEINIGSTNMGTYGTFYKSLDERIVLGKKGIYRHSEGNYYVDTIDIKCKYPNEKNFKFTYKETCNHMNYKKCPIFHEIEVDLKG